MTPELVKWLIGALAGCTCTIIAAVAWLSVLVFRIGAKYGSVETKLEHLDGATTKLEKATERLTILDTLASKVDQLEESHAEERRRFTSDWPELVSKVDVLWEKVFSISEWRKSKPHFGGGGDGGRKQ